jgi:hypothetical protein
MDYAMNDKEIERQIRERLSVKQPLAFRALGLGKRKGKAAVADGSIPTIDVPGQPVPTEWLRQQLMINTAAPQEEAQAL